MWRLTLVAGLLVSLMLLAVMALAIVYEWPLIRWVALYALPVAVLAALVAGAVNHWSKN